jgi:magnesium transporter
LTFFVSSFLFGYRVIHTTLDLVVDTFQPVVSDLCSQVEILEDLAFALSIFEHRDLLKRISIVRKRLAWCIQGLSSKKCMLSALLGAEWRTMLSTVDVPYLRDVADHNTRMMQKLHQANEMLQHLQDTYLATVNNEVALASERMNQTMGKLTSLSMIFMPLSLIPGLMGMNCFVPFQLDEPYTGTDYFVETIPFIGIIVVMILLGLFGLWFMKHRKLI